MTDTKLELSALGYATLMIVVASMMAAGTMNAVQGAWTLVPATLVMVLVAIRARRSSENA